MPLPSIRTSRGMTLVEMSFVLLIVVVIVAMAFYSYKAYSGNPKHMEAALLAHEIKQDISLRHQAKRELPEPYVLSHVSRKTVSGAEVIRDGSSGVRVNVYLNGDSANTATSNQVYTLYGNLVNGELAWVDCGKDCVKNAVDIPPAAPVPPSKTATHGGDAGNTGSGGGNDGSGPDDDKSNGGINVAVAPPKPPTPPVTSQPPAKPEKPKFKVFSSVITIRYGMMRKMLKSNALSDARMRGGNGQVVGGQQSGTNIQCVSVNKKSNFIRYFEPIHCCQWMGFFF